MRYQLRAETGRSAFATREAAAGVRAKLSAGMAALASGDTLVLDLVGVEAMTISFADELVAKLAAERRVHGIADTHLLLVGASPEVAETIAVALERRDLFAAHERPDRGVELLAAPDHLQRTYATARELGEFTARDLAERLGITLPAANNRIKALAQAGVVTRKRHDPVHGGRQFLYQVEHAA